MTVNIVREVFARATDLSEVGIGMGTDCMSVDAISRKFKEATVGVDNTQTGSRGFGWFVF